MEKIKKDIIGWVRNNKEETVILLFILLIGAFLRLYRISEYMTFLGDEGRDAIVVRRLLVNFDPILIGPRTSIGDMYLGPLYYYMMAPALALSFLSPVGPAVMIALLGVATIFFVWIVAREWFSGATFKGEPLQGVYNINFGALFAAGLYAVSPVVITHARHSWNPNIMPFFALLVIYGLWRIFVHRTTGLWPGQKRFKWLIVVGISFAFVLQSHYLGLLLAPTIGLFWLLTFIKLRQAAEDKRKTESKNFLRFTLYGLLVFILLMSPLVIFDARHDWRNFASMKKFFGERQTTVSARPWIAIPKLPQIVSMSNVRLITGKNEQVGNWITLVIASGVAILSTTLLYSIVVKKRLTDKLKAYFLILVWLGFAFVGLGVYKQYIYDHYYEFFFTAPFLLLGGLAQELVHSTKSTGKILVVAAFGLLVYVNLRENPLKYPPNRQMQRTIEVSEKISQEAKGERFNLAVVAERNYEDAYQYFLEKWREPVVDIDPLNADETITEQLFVVCELPRERCDPTHNPKAEVANFGWSKVEDEWIVEGVTVYKLVHSQ